MSDFEKFYRSPDGGGEGSPAPAPAPAAPAAPAPAPAPAAPAAPAPAPATPKPSAFMGDDGGAGGVMPPKPEWAAGVSDENWANMAANGYKDINDLAGAHNSAQTKIGADKVVIPGEDAKPEEWDTLYNSLGRPAESKDYVITPPEGVEFTEDQLAFQANFNDAAHKVGLTQAQHTGLVEWNNGLLEKAAIDQAAAESKETEQTKATLRQHYGKDADDKLDAANAFIANVGGDGVVDAFVKSGMSRNFPVIDMIIKVADMAAGEGGLVGTGGGGGGGATSIQAQIDKERASPAYTDDRHADHAAVKARVGKLYKMKKENKG